MPTDMKNASNVGKDALSLKAAEPSLSGFSGG